MVIHNLSRSRVIIIWSIARIERELFSYAHENDLATTPYSPLASGRLAHPFGTQTTRRQQDTFADTKYQATSEMDKPIIDCVEELAHQHHVSMAAINFGL